MVSRKSDLPVGGFIVLNNETIDVKFISLWKEANGIEKLNLPKASDRYNFYQPSSLIDKSELDLILPTPNEVILLEGESSISPANLSSTQYDILIDKSGLQLVL